MKRVMKGWQFAIITVLLVALLGTMFMPVISINKRSIKKLAGTMSDLTNLSDYGFTGESVDDVDDAILDEELDKLEQESTDTYGFSITKITPLTLMTKSFMPKDMDKEEAKESDDYINTTPIKIALWIIYGLAIVLLIFNILAFCLQFNKIISGVIDIFYGFLAAAFFGFGYFGMPGFVAKAVGEKAFGNMGAVSGFVEEGIKAVIKPFISFGFLAACIIAALLLIASVITVVVGAPVQDYVDDEIDYDHPIDDQYTFGRQEEPPILTPPEPPVTPPQPPVTPYIPPVPVEPTTPPMGQVKCTKGVALGHGFRITADTKVVVGKSRTNANLVINNQNVSNIHCSIRYNPSRNVYIVKDHSMNGTFVNGVRMQNNQPMEFKAGTVLSLADGSNEITLG